MINFNKLKGKMIEKFGSQKAFAKAAGISIGCLSYKMNGKRTITYADIVKWSNLLEIEQNEIAAIFFDKNVQSA